tara:strand:+ start:5321 stop:5656 length:336 start_codon:yes stop_codon:yes gene_type:complete
MSDVEKLFQSWREHIKEYAKAAADYEYLSEYRKSKKAILMGEALTQGEDKANAQERYAYSHHEYLALLDGIRAAREKAEELRWRMKLAEHRVGAWQTGEANARAEFKKYGN